MKIHTKQDIKAHKRFRDARKNKRVQWQVFEQEDTTQGHSKRLKAVY